MPLKIPSDALASIFSKAKNIFVMDQNRAMSRDIRPLEIAIVNLMPTKIVTETQLLRADRKHAASGEHYADQDRKSRSEPYLTRSIWNLSTKNFSDIKKRHFDGLIITGAPVETLPFEEKSTTGTSLPILSDELNQRLLDISYLLGRAQAGLYYHYGIQKHPLPKKLFGIYEHVVRDRIYSAVPRL